LPSTMVSTAARIADVVRRKPSSGIGVTVNAAP
jgi:hypothetical protein